MASVCTSGGKKPFRLGFGCMRFPTLENGKIDREKATEMLDYAYQNGVNYFDTAYFYHDGESEEFVGEALSRYPRESFYLTTKMPLWETKTKEDVEQIFEKQLKNCRTDYFDYYLLHSMDKKKWQTAQELDALGYLLKQKEQGRIRKIGFSFHGEYEDFVAMVDYYPWDFVQIQINYIDDKVQNARAYYDKLLEKDIPCLAMEPIRGGFLASLPADMVAPLTQAAPEMTAAHWALRWCMSQENIAIILSGMSTLEQVKENVAVFQKGQPLSPEELALLEQVRDELLAAETIPCTACRYCMDCSFGVDIPEVFRYYNELALFRNKELSQKRYAQLGEHTAAACVKCGACLPMCPQGIQIPEMLEKAQLALA